MEGKENLLAVARVARHLQVASPMSVQSGASSEELPLPICEISQRNKPGSQGRESE